MDSSLQLYAKEELEAGVVFLVDKPKTWTSFDVVNKLRYLFRLKKIGHAGTLDPLATGLLVICTGKATKSIEQIQAQPKTYRAELFLGATTASYDAEMPVEAVKDPSNLTLEQIQAVLPQFVGHIFQRPPTYSAVMLNGKRAYQLARSGVAVEMPIRQVVVHQISVIGFELPYLTLEIRCGKGTYIRSLANDLGLALGCGAYLSNLCRTSIGSYELKDAVKIEQLVQFYKSFYKSG